ncbi:hypothetical protein BY996DRAFT_6441205 [Phakopsora pachyrhizi]|nr:hypothetical protein BY996DRAFT_6441205 [Phakopsora pachyrhizi]
MSTRSSNLELLPGLSDTNQDLIEWSEGEEEQERKSLEPALPRGDGVAPEDDTVTDDRNNRERSRVRTSTNPVDEDVKNYSNGLMNGSNVIRSNGMNDMVTRTRVHSSLVVGHIGPYILF